MSETQLAGNVILSQGNVEAQGNGRSRLLAQGGAVCVGETIVTSKSAAVQIRMTDEGLIAVRPQSQLEIRKYVYSGTGSDSSRFALHKGSSRFVTGKIGKAHPENDLVETQYATIGVHGTDHEVTVILPGGIGGYPSGTYDKVNQGITFMRTGKGQIDINPGQVAFAASMGEMPALLKNMPDFYRSSIYLKDGRPFEEWHKEEDSGNNKIEEHSLESSGSGSEITGPDESGAAFGEHPDSSIDLGRPESPDLPEPPKIPSLPAIPERPD